MTMSPPDQQPVGRRAEVLQLLRDMGEPMGVAEISQRLGIHANTARFHLKTLVDNGQIQRTTTEPATPGRPPQLYQPVPGMDPMGPRRYRVLAEILVATFAATPDAGRRGLEAGRAWGRHRGVSTTNTIDKDHAIEPVEQLVGMLEELGFAPEQTPDGHRHQIGLRNCPFLELATSHSEVVCSVHLGLMQGAMETWGSPVRVTKLDAFVEPNLCLADLASPEVS